MRLIKLFWPFYYPGLQRDIGQSSNLTETQWWPDKLPCSDICSRIRLDIFGTALPLKIPCLFFQNCLHLTFEPYLSSETYSRKYEKQPNIVTHACKIYRKSEFVDNVWPANSTLFIYVSTYCVETVKQLDYIQFSWLGGPEVTHPPKVWEVPGSIPGFGKSFYVFFIFDVVFGCCYVFTFLSLNTLYVIKFCKFLLQCYFI